MSIALPFSSDIRLSMTFGDWLRKKRTEKGYSLRELSRLANGACTHGYISQLEKNTGGKKGAYQPDIEIVDSLAEALDAPINEARLAAGYAPKTITRKPETIPELVAALEQLGIERHRTEVRLYPISTPLSAHISAYIATRIPPKLRR